MRIGFAIFAFLLIVSCKSKTAKSVANKVEFLSPDYKSPGPQAFVYRTKKNYDQLVPILLSDDKKIIVSYPDPSDLLVENKLILPIHLHNGYLLDEKGINQNVAFLQMKYEEYAKLKSPPSIEELKSMIIDDDPLEEICNCGYKNAISNPVKQLNLLIDSGKLRSICNPLK